MLQRLSALGRRPASALTTALLVSVGSAAVAQAPQPTRPAVKRPQASSHPREGATVPLNVAQRAQFQSHYGQMPLQFEQNRGQAPTPIQFLSMHGAYEVALTPDQLVLNLKSHGAGSTDGLISMRLQGANPNPVLTGEQELPGKVNYFLGNKSEKWHTGISTFSKVRMKEVYPGIDLVYYGNQKQLEYDFVVKPGIDPAKIKLSFTGNRSLHLEENGDLFLRARAGEVRWKRPEVYQMIDGKRRAIASRYKIRSERKGASHVGFEIAQYDHSRPLVIDPTLLIRYYDTLTNAGGAINSATWNSMVADASGNVYAVATSDVTSATYATATAIGGATSTATKTFTKLPAGANANHYMLVMKLDSTGAITYSDIIGGSVPDLNNDYGDFASGIAIDSSGSAYIIGSAQAPDFPMAGTPYQTFVGFSGNANGGSHVARNAYIAKLNPAGNALVYASYFGGRATETGVTIAVNAAGTVLYVGGNTPTTRNFPALGGRNDALGTPALSTNGFQTTYGGSFNDGYVARLNDPSGTGAAYNILAYSTLMGGVGPDNVRHMVIDPTDDNTVYVVGATERGTAASADFFHDLTNGFQTSYTGIDPGFLARIDTSQTGTNSLVYATYIGGLDSTSGAGQGVNEAESVAFAGNGIVYITGQTNSTNFPITANALQSTHGGTSPNGNADAFLLEVNTTLTGASSKLYASYLGGGGVDYGAGIAFDGTSVYVTGRTGSIAVTGAFPTSNAINTANQGGPNIEDGFVAKFTETNASTHAHQMDFSTYLGTSLDDAGAGIGVDSSGGIYVMGDVVSAANVNGIFFAKLNVNHAPVADAQFVTVTKDTAKAITLTSSDADGDTRTYSIVANPAHGALSGLNTSTGAVTYTPTTSYSGADSFTFKVNDGHEDSNTATITINVVGAPTANAQTVAVSHNTAKSITLTGSDPNSPALSLTYIVTTSPTHGTLSGTAPNLTYTPTSGYAGSDSFQFKVNNGSLDSNVATVTLNVAAAAPTANAQTVTVLHNTPKSITLTGSDPNVPAQTLTFTIATTPTHGALSGLNAATGAVTYTPTTGYAGTDSFTFTVKNGSFTSSPATVTLNVNAAAPVANTQTVAVAHNTATAVTLTGSDPNVPVLTPLTFSVTVNPTHGTLSGTAPNLTYTPATGYSGSDSFQFTVTNTGNVTGSAATVTLNVAAAAPTANSQSVSTNQNTAVGVTLTSSDPNVPALGLTYNVTANPAHGTLTGTAPNLTYTPATGYTGPDSFQFTVTNSANLTSSAGTVSISVVGTVTDVTGQISVASGPFLYSRATGTYTQVLTLTNTGGTAITGPISVILSNLANATLANATGTTSALLPAARPYINVGAIGAGASVSVSLSFTKTGAGSITYSVQIAAGPGSR
jgi:hypothetical protein